MTAEEQKQGTLYGLGIGPGDPDLITLKAFKVIQKVPVIAYPAPDTGPSLARTIAASHIPDGLIEITIRTPMVPGNDPADDVYDHYAIEIANHLQGGRDVAVLCEGDPFFYGSFMYLFERLSDEFLIQIVPGVSSLGASAAAARLPLVSRKDTMTILPGPLSEEELENRLQASDTAVIMKVGRHLPKIRKVLDRLNLTNGATYIEHASMENQKVLPLKEANMETAPYFSIILVPLRTEVSA